MDFLTIDQSSQAGKDAHKLRRTLLASVAINVVILAIFGVLLYFEGVRLYTVGPLVVGCITLCIYVYGVVVASRTWKKPLKANVLASVFAAVFWLAAIVLLVILAIDVGKGFGNSSSRRTDDESGIPVGVLFALVMGGIFGGLILLFLSAMISVSTRALLKTMKKGYVRASNTDEGVNTYDVHPDDGVGAYSPPPLSEKERELGSRL
eukprot:TRINITY_DN13203_c0_g1_i1.p1 TRINITY_DN13203_c0_g1~~TRINITY_DN13203_c0_g1_i1.p1  ORF type:complete len:215 (+),score=47.76 TRINITY_DN13203_c0_g1_i1:25-645(+)